MHIICDDCFKKAAPVEELTHSSLLLDPEKCAYCDKESPASTCHRLAGNTPHWDICYKLGVSTRNCSFFELAEQQQDINIEFATALAEDPREVAETAIHFLRKRGGYGDQRLAKLIEFLDAHSTLEALELALTKAIEKIEQAYPTGVGHPLLGGFGGMRKQVQSLAQDFKDHAPLFVAQDASPEDFKAILDKNWEDYQRKMGE